MGKILNKPMDKVPTPVAIGQSPPQPPQWWFNGLMGKEAMEVGVEHTDGLEDTDFAEANLPPSSAEVQLANGMNHPLSPNTVFPGWTSLPPGGGWTELNPFYHEASAFVLMDINTFWIWTCFLHLSFFGQHHHPPSNCVCLRNTHYREKKVKGLLHL